MTPPSRCAVLVPIGGCIDPGCEAALQEIERRGYPVRRVRGYSAVDAARNQMATDALAGGFDELFWIDSDIVFDPADVDRLRAHNLPFACGLYPKKGPREMACAFLPGTSSVTFGAGGGLVEVRYCGFGFAHTRRAVYDAVRETLRLPTLNQRFPRPLVPYFAPLAVKDGAGGWYLGEDYAFCERARQAGVRVMADTTIRLWHVGAYRYGWEDAGRSPDRYSTYVFHLPPDGPPPSA
ncbi:MAG: DUF4350 domain-containing protein [Gemmataceae bacterium]|nr:DUF4350 domain-containing protein [Gemmataceae bacterium]